MQQQPSRYNLGGIWLLNPPEPTMQTTELRGALQHIQFPHVFPSGGSRVIPPAWKLIVEEKAPEELIPAKWLIGEFILHRSPVVFGDQTWSNDVFPFVHTVPGNRLLGRWESLSAKYRFPDDPDINPELPDSRDVYQNRPLWSLFYGTAALPGPANDTDGWWLVPAWPRYDSYVYRGPLRYYFHHPAAEPNATSTNFTTHSLGNFDALGANVFRMDFYENDPAQWIAGNLDLTVEPFYL